MVGIPMPIGGASGGSAANFNSPVTRGLVANWSMPSLDTFDSGTSAVNVNSLVASPADGSSQTDNRLQRGDGSTSTTYPAITCNTADFDGGDWLTKAAANTTFYNSLHKDNAAFTIWAYMKFASSDPTARAIAATANSGGGGHIGIRFGKTSANKLAFYQYNGSSEVTIAIGDSTLTLGNYQFFALSYDETSGGFFRVDKAYSQVSASDTFATAYTSPSTSNATYKFTLAALSDAGLSPWPSGSALVAAGIHNVSLTATECDQIYDGIVSGQAIGDARWPLLRY